MFDSTKFCSCRAMNTVIKSSFDALSRRSLSLLILNCCSIVSFVTGGGGRLPKDWLSESEVIVLVLQDLSKPSVEQSIVV